MNDNTQNSKATERGKPGEDGYKNEADVTPRREGGDDALAETNPQDSRADEKVIFNDLQTKKPG